MNRTLEIYKSLELPSEAPGFDVNPDYHPSFISNRKSAASISLVSPLKSELPPIFRKLADHWESNGLQKLSCRWDTGMANLSRQTIVISPTGEFL